MAAGETRLSLILRVDLSQWQAGLRAAFAQLNGLVEQAARQRVRVAVDDSGITSARAKVDEIRSALDRLSKRKVVFSVGVDGSKAAPEAEAAGKAAADAAKKAADAARAAAKDAGFTEATEDLREYRNILGEALRQLRSEGKASSTEYAKIREAILQMNSALGETPKQRPRPSAPPPSPGGGGVDPSLKAEQDAVAAAEQKLAALKIKYEKDAGQQIISDLVALQERKKVLRLAETQVVDGEAKKRIQIEKRAVDQEISLLSGLARQKKAVNDEGAGAPAGILGLFRRVQGEGVAAFQGIGKAIPLAAMGQFAQQASDAFNQLSQPFVALDTATAQLRTLGPEAAALAGPLRDASILMSKELPFAASELQTTMFDALASGVQGGEQGLKRFAETAAKLATGGGSGIGEATSLLAGQLNAYGKSADEASRFADIFFNTVNYGVTSIPALSSTLANVIPTAAAAGIELENVGGALALMTQKGIPTAQSTTKLNQLLIELQKPGAALAPILKEAGISLESLKQDDLPVTLGKLKTALDSTGKAAVQVFGSSEAAAAFQTLSGDLAGFEQTFRDVRDTVGSTDNAYTEMAGSIEVQTKRMLSAAQAFVIEGLDAIGGGVISVVNAAGQLAPMVTTLSGLSSLFVTDNVKEYAKTLVTETIPGLYKSAAAKVLMAKATAAEAVATGTATVAQRLLNLVMSANPIFLIIGGIGTLVGLYALFSDGTKDLGEATKDTNAALDTVQKTMQNASAITRQSDELRKLADEYDALSGKTDPASMERFAEVSQQLVQKVPIAGEAVENFSAAGEKVNTTYSASTEIVRQFADEQQRLAEIAKSDALLQLEEETAALGESTREAIEDRAALREETAKLRDIVAQGGGDVQSEDVFGNPFDTIRDDLVDATADTQELNAKIQEQAPQIEAIVQRYQKLGFTADEVLQKLGLTREELAGIGVNFAEGAVGAEQLTSALSGISDETAKRAVVAANQQVAAYQDAAAQVAELQGDLQIAEISGNTEMADSIRKELAEAQKVADEEKVKLQTVVEDGKVAETLAKLPDAVRSRLGPITATVQLLADEKGLADAQRSAGAALRNIAQLQQDVANSTGEAQARATAQLTAEQDRYRESLLSQADGIQAMEEEYQRLQVAKNNALTTEEAERLAGEMAVLDGRINAASEQFVTTAKAAQKFGVIKGDVRDVGREFNASGRSAAGVETATRRAEKEATKLASSAASIGEEFENMRKAANEGFNKSLSEAAGLLLKQRREGLDQLEADRLTRLRADLKQFVKDQKEFESIVEQLETEAGKRKVERRRASARQLSSLDIDRREFDLRLQEQFIDDEVQRELTRARNEESIARARAERAKQQAQADYDASEKTAEDQRKKNEEIARQDLAIRNAQLTREAVEKQQRLKIQRDLGIEQLRLQDELMQAEVDRIRQNAELIEGETISAIAARTEATVRALELERDQKLLATITGDSEFARRVRQEGEIAAGLVADAKTAAGAAQQALNVAKAQLAEGKGTQAQVDQAQSTYDQAQATLLSSQAAYTARLAEIRRGFITELTASGATLTPELQRTLNQYLAVQSGMQQQIEKATTEGEEKLKEARDKARLAGITDAAEKEREVTLQEARKTYSDLTLLLGEAEAEIRQEVSDAARATAEGLRVLAEFDATKARILADAGLSPAERDRQLREAEDQRDRELGLIEERLLGEGRYQDRIAALERERLRSKGEYLLAEMDAERAFQRERLALVESALTTEEKLREEFRRRGELRTQDDAKKEREDLRQRSRDLQQAYRAGLIDTQTYYEERHKLAIAQLASEARFNEVGNRLLTAIQRGFLETSERLRQTFSERAQQAANTELQLRAARATLLAQQDEATKKGEVERATELGRRVSQADREIAQQRTQIYLQTTAAAASALGASFGQLIATGSDNFGDYIKVLLNVMLDGLQALVPLLVFQITSISLASPESIATAGAAGFVKAAGMTLLLEGLLAGAKAYVQSFATGVVGLRGPGTDTSDSIPAFLSAGESVITARGTRTGNNTLFLEALNRTGGDLRDIVAPSIALELRQQLLPILAGDLRSLIGPLLSTEVRRMMAVHASGLDPMEMRRLMAHPVPGGPLNGATPGAHQSADVRSLAAAIAHLRDDLGGRVDTQRGAVEKAILGVKGAVENQPAPHVVIDQSGVQVGKRRYEERYWHGR